jgi:hypothetical protein
VACLVAHLHHSDLTIIQYLTIGLLDGNLSYQSRFHFDITVSSGCICDAIPFEDNISQETVLAEEIPKVSLNRIIAQAADIKHSCFKVPVQYRYPPNSLMSSSALGAATVMGGLLHSPKSEPVFLTKRPPNAVSHAVSDIQKSL